MNELDRYIGGVTLRIVLLSAAGLTMLFSLLTFVEQLGFVGQGRYHVRDALVYALLTSPYRLLQLAPVCILLGTLLALGGLARRSELTAFRALGVSEARIIGAVLKLLVPIAAVLFLTAQFLIPAAQHMAQREQATALTDTAPLLSDGGFWVEHGGEYLNVQQFAYGNVPEDIDIYRFGGDGGLISYIHAASAAIAPDGTWQLADVLEKQVAGSQFITTRLAVLPWRSFLSAKQMGLLMLPPETMPPLALYRYIRDLKSMNEQAVRDEQILWSMLSIPVAMFAMVLIAAPFVFGGQRTQSAGRQLLIGVFLGIVFQLAQQITFYLGVLLDLNPAITAMTPPCLMLAAALYLLRRSHITLRR